MVADEAALRQGGSTPGIVDASPRLTLRTRILVALALLVSGAVTCTLYQPWRQPLLKDNQHYFYISERAASGVPPHVGHFDPKHQLSSLLTAGVIWIGRHVGVSDMASSRALSIFITAASISLIGLLALELFPNAWAAILSGFIVLTFGGYFEMGVMGAQPKVFMVPPILLTMLAVGRQRYFWSGFASTLSFLCWQPTLMLLPFAAAVALVRPGRFKNLGWLLLGALPPYAAYEAYFALYGATAEMHLQAYWFPAKYMAEEASPFDLLLRQVKNSWREGFGSIYLLPVLFGFIVVAAGCAAMFRLRTTARFLRNSPAWLYFVLSGVGLLAFSFLDHQGYPDLFLNIPTLAVSCALGIVVSLAWLLRGRTAFVHHVPAVVVLAVLAWMAAAAPGKFPYTFYLEDQYRLAEKIKRQVEAGETVYAVGCTHLLAFSHLDNHVIYGFFFRGLPDYVGDLVHDKAAYRPVDAEGRMPDIIIKSRQLLPAHKQWLPQDYDPLSKPQFEDQEIEFWKRKAHFEDQAQQP